MIGSSHDRKLVSVLALLAGAALWGLVWYPMRLLEETGLTGLWLTLLIYSFTLVVSLPVTGRKFGEVIQSPAILLPILLAAGWTNIAFVLAILDGNILRVLLLFYLAPVWATLLGYYFLGERLTRRSWLVLVLAMAGALIMLWSPEMGWPWPSDTSDWMAITSGMAFAISNLFVRKGQSVSLAAKLGVSWLGVVVMAGILIVIFQQPVPAMSMPVVSGAAATGIFGILVMTTLVQYGVTHMPVHQSAVILLFEIVVGAISQQLLTDEMMTLREWGGGVLIILAAYLSTFQFNNESSFKAQSNKSTRTD